MMKKVVSFVLVTALILSLTVNVTADETYTVDDFGNIVEFHGTPDEVIAVRAEVDGKPVTRLDSYVFYNSPINTVYMEDGIEVIGESCFEDSTVEYIDFPITITEIDDYAFRNCEKLQSFSLYTDKIKFGEDVFKGTGFLHIGVPCTLDLLSLHDEIRDAKGDENFQFDIMHTDLVESMVEKDAFGRNMMICNACGFKGSVYFDNVEMPFEDVANDTWYYSYVSTAYEFGILNGKSETVFDPNANMTLAEAAKIAACVHMYFYGGVRELPAGGREWFEPYVDYCYENRIIDYGVSFDWYKNATRAEMAYLFSNADLGDCIVNPDVPLSDIPDVDTATPYAVNILELYRRGIAAGSDEYMTFYPDANVLRAEAAAFISRMICYDMRVNLPKG